MISPKPILVFDIDETLVYSTLIAPNDLDNVNYFTILMKKRKFYVQKRPFLNECLERLSKIFDIYFFTTSVQEYAIKIIRQIYPNFNKRQIFSRDSCTEMCGYLVKDLNKINFPITKILLIDDSSGSALKSPTNLVKIKPWNGEKNDDALKDLTYVLENIADKDDLRTSYIEFIKSRMFDGIGTF